MAADSDIHLPCGKCQTVYRLDPANLLDGRMVRCSSCKHTWYQLPPVDGVLPGPLAEAPAPPAPTAAPVYQRPEWMNEEEQGQDDLTFRPSTKGQYFLEDDMRVLPEAVKPEQPPSKTAVPMEAILHKPMGMGAAQYGVFVFLFLCFLTFSGLLVGRQQVVQHYPATLALYNALHVGVEAPGQGLTLSEMAAENHIDKAAHTLAIDVKLANISDHAITYPAMRVAVKDADGKVAHAPWEFPADKGKKLAAGESMPVKITLKDAPDDAKTAAISVTGN